MATHLVVFYTATAGVNGPNLGSDEEDMVLIQYLVWDIVTSKVLTEQQYLVRPSGSDVNENVLSEQCREDYGLAEEQVKNGQPLESVIDSFEGILGKLEEAGSKVNLVTDGQLHLRQVLHPKSVAKGLELPPLYNRFFDLRKEFKAFFHVGSEVTSVKDMLDYLEIAEDENSNQAVKAVRGMAQIIKRMTSEGHRFAIPEEVNIRLEPGICTRGEEVDNGCVVRARGLPWQSSDQDIAKFFRGLNIAKGGVALCLSPQGRRNGEALIRFVSAEHRDMALKRHKHHIGNRYIEVYKATGEDFINVAGGNNNEAQQFLSRGGQVIIRMRGLPYDCTAKQVVEFFESGENGCQILDCEEGVLFVRKPDGRATGDAFVLFASEEDSGKALAKHREIIGSRYIELFRSTTAEVQQVLNRSMDPRTYEQQQPLIGQMPQMPMLPQQFITTTNRRDCIRLRGLPYEARVEHVLEFLGDHAKNIVFRGVHMVINSQGQPSGEAFIQMDTEQSAFLAAQNRHHRYMVFGKKQRYIEVFQCSGEDMNLVLSGGLPAQRTVVSPGMLMWDQSAGSSPSAVQPGTPAAAAAAAAAVAAAAAPGIFPTGSTRPSLPGAAAVLPAHHHPPPPFPHPSFPTAPNGTYFQGLVTAQMKPETVLVSNPMLSHTMRPQLLQQSPLEVTPHPSQTQNAALLQSLKSSTMSPQTTPQFHPALLGQYGELGIAGQGVHPGMVIVPSSKLPSVSIPTGLPPPMSFVTVSSAPDTRKSLPQNFQPKYSFSTASLLPMPYVSAPSAGMPPSMRMPVSVTAAAGGGAKRSFEQAFSTDKNNPLRPYKKPPPRLPNASLPHGPLGSPRVNAPHINAAHMTPAGTPQSHLNPAAAAAPLAAAAPMISALYPPQPMYPPAM